MPRLERIGVSVVLWMWVEDPRIRAVKHILHARRIGKAEDTITTPRLVLY